MSDIDAKILVALIGGLASLLIAILGIFFTRRNQKALEKLKAEYADSKSEKDALRDYEYEAKKRLYHECGPLLFLLLESSERALKRIVGIARAASGGNLSGQDTWFSKNYYKLSTWHTLLQPAAIVNLIQKRLTLLDLSLDPLIYIQYSITKIIYQSFAHDFKLAKLSQPELKYDPHSPDAEEIKLSNPEEYYQQGIPIGILDNAIDSMIIKESNETWRLMSFAEFEREYLNEDSNLHKAFKRIEYLFDQFHPKTRPVLWRILVVQANLYSILLQTRSMNSRALNISAIIENNTLDKTQFDWRNEKEKNEPGINIDEPSMIYKKYFDNNVLPVINDICKNS